MVILTDVLADDKSKPEYNFLASSKQQIDNLELTKYYWRPNDNFYKISEKFYGDPKYWYVIAQFNKLPFEGDIKVGDTIMVPRPLARVVQVMK